MAQRYAVVQPWLGARDVSREHTTLSVHSTAYEAFAAIDAMSGQMVRTRAPSDAVTLIVIDARGRIVTRPRSN